MPKSQFKAKHKGESKSQYKQCVPPCKRYLCAGDTHSLCVVCLGARHAEAALEVADCPHCESLPLRMLRSRKALFLKRVLSLAFPAALAPLPLRRSGSGVHGVRSGIWWRDRRRANLYLRPHLSDPMTAPRVWKPARRILPLGQRPRPRRFSCLPPRRLTQGTSNMLHPLFHPNMRSLWRWSLMPWPSWVSIGRLSVLSNRRDAN